MRKCFSLLVLSLFIACTSSAKEKSNKTEQTFLAEITEIETSGDVLEDEKSLLNLSDLNEGLKHNIKYTWHADEKDYEVQVVEILNDTITLNASKFLYDKVEVSALKYIHESKGINEYAIGYGSEDKITCLKLIPISSSESIPKNLMALCDAKIQFVNLGKIRILRDKYPAELVNPNYLADAVQLPISYLQMYNSSFGNTLSSLESSFVDVEQASRFRDLVLTTKPILEKEFKHESYYVWLDRDGKTELMGNTQVMIIKKGDDFFTYLLLINANTGEFSWSNFVFIATAKADEAITPIDVMYLSTEKTNFNINPDLSFEIISDNLKDDNKYDLSKDSLLAKVDRYQINESGNIVKNATSKRMAPISTLYLEEGNAELHNSPTHVDSLHWMLTHLDKDCKSVLPLKFLSSYYSEEAENEMKKNGFWRGSNGCEAKKVPISILKYLDSYDYYWDYFGTAELPISWTMIGHHIEGLDVVFVNEEYDMSEQNHILVCKGDKALSKLSLGASGDGVASSQFIIEKDLTIKVGKWLDFMHFYKFHSWKIQEDGSIVQLD